MAFGFICEKNKKMVCQGVMFTGKERGLRHIINAMERLGIYFFFDKEGIVDEYVDYVLENILRNVKKLIVVCNGILSDEGRKKFEKYTNYIIVRENKGFDVWAYKTALDSEGWEELVKYDEVILMNYTIMGPVYSLEEMFLEMTKKKNLDFWGITKCFREDSPVAQEMWKNPYEYIPEHIQSSFMVFRRSILSADIFQKYWNEMPMINSYYESGCRHEQFITKYFADHGFKWDCYTNYDDLDEKAYGCCPLITAPLEVVKKRKSPFFKRRTFFTMKEEYNATTPFIKEFLDFLENETSYDTSLVYPNMIRNYNQRDLAENFLLFHVI